MEILFFILNVATLVFLLSKFVDWKIAMHEWQNDLGDTNKEKIMSRYQIGSYS